MQVYLVGGAVRDALLGQEVHDKDFVVVGGNASDMMALGFSQVGADFPVFLHPSTHREYALARTERKNGTGYQGFATETKGVSLTDDLLRRDLTINALAIEVKSLFDDTPITGEIIDYHGGLNDLKNKTLRHISPAFSEDPLRILRTVRFLARYYDDGFRIALDTITLMQNMAKAGELSHLSRERLWTESVKTMENGTAHTYWQQLRNLQILPYFLKELDDAWRNEAIFNRSIQHLKNAKNDNIAVQFAILCASFLDNHQTQSAKPLINAVAERLNTPKYPVQIAHLLAEFCVIFHEKPTAADIINFIEKTKAHQGNLNAFNDTLAAIFIVNDTAKAGALNIQALLRQAIDAYKSVSIDDIDKGLKGREIGAALTERRVQKIQQLLSEHHAKPHS